MPLSQLLVEESAPLTTRVHAFTPLDESSVQDGQVLVHVAKLALTANTQTYALAGKHPLLKYFNHFPAPSDAPVGHALCPCWGVGVVQVSKCDGISVGTRVYGYYTFSPCVILTPSKVSAASFVDAATHRQDLIVAYNQYFTAQAPMFKDLDYSSEDFHMSMGLLFSTGWAMTQTAVLHPAKPTAIVLTSASSRTSVGAAFAAKFHKMELQVIGATSARNKEFVKGMGFYDVVVTYDELATLQKQRVAVLDVAGDSNVQESLYRHYGDDLIYCGGVGMSHVGTAGQRAKLKGLGGKPPVPFLVFSGLAEAAKAYGQKDCDRMLIDATMAYRAAMMPKFQAVRSFGTEATQRIWNDMANNKCKPELTYIVSMWSEGEHDSIRLSKL